MKKVAVIWGLSRQEKKTHHVYWEAALRERPDIQTERFTWTEWPSIPSTFDLYFFVDFHPALFRLPEDRLRPRVFYWWDCFHYSLSYVGRLAEYFDRSYFAEKKTAEILKAFGAEHAYWLPMAFDPVVYHPIPESVKLHQYGFMGQLDDLVVHQGDTRKGFLDRLAAERGFHGYVGNAERGNYLVFDEDEKDRSAGAYGAQLNQIYNESQVLFDRTIWTNLGARFFEGIGSGSFFLMNRGPVDNGVDEVATEGEHFASYDGSFGDFKKKLRFYLSQPETLGRVARQGREYFLKYHTYAARIEVILKDMGLL